MTGLWQVRCRASIARRENTRDYSLLGPQTLVPKEAGLNTTCTRQDKLVTSQNQCHAHKQVPSWEGRSGTSCTAQVDAAAEHCVLLTG